MVLCPVLGSPSLDILIHEFCHPYCNPLIDRIFNNIASSAEAYFKANGSILKQQAYNNAQHNNAYPQNIPEINIDDEEIKSEIIDTVEYFSSRSAFYHIDPSRSAFVGFSGGAYLMMGAAAILHTKGMDLKGMISFYPLIDDSSIQLVDQGIYRTPITFITCENQQEIQMVDHLVSHLEQAGVQTDVRNYSAAVTGFIEVNNPEYEQNRYYQKGRDQMYTQDQKDYAAACEIWMAGVLERYFEKEN